LHEAVRALPEQIALNQRRMTITIFDQHDADRLSTRLSPTFAFVESFGSDGKAQRRLR
jgi:hypothetical protein